MRVILLLGFAKIFKFYWGLLRLKQRLLKLECFFAVDMGIQDFILEGDS